MKLYEINESIVVAESLEDAATLSCQDLILEIRELPDSEETTFSGPGWDDQEEGDTDEDYLLTKTAGEWAKILPRGLVPEV